MFDNLSNDDISIAIDELTTCVGVKEEAPFSDILALIHKKDAQGCVQGIAARLGLPVRVDLSYVPQDFRPSGVDKFRSAALVRTDWTGRGVESITAQVSIPECLPMFGTSDLQGYPIRVRVSENCHEHAETFVAMMAHELSHVLLRSLHHHRKDSELHADLLPILLGFGDVVCRGRKTVQSTTSGDMTTTRTTTYGYLTDSQFEFACAKARQILRCRQRDKHCLQDLVTRTRRQFCRATRGLATFRDYMRYLDEHPTRRMRRDHALAIVGFHQWDYARQWQVGIDQAGAALDRVEMFVRPLTHYTGHVVQQIEDGMRSLLSVSEQLTEVSQAINRDLKIIRRYVRLTYRLRRALRLRSRSSDSNAAERSLNRD